MPKDSTQIEHVSPNATLAAIGCKLQSLKFFAPIERLVRIPQKSIDHQPCDKLKDAFIVMLAGAEGISEVNKLLRTDPALQRAFGREACAEQSTVQDTLSASTAENIAQMQTAFDEIFRRHGRAARHDDTHSWFVVDADLTGLPCGPKAEGAKKGYLSGEGIRTGRQLARVVASQYGEVVTDLVFPGNTVMPNALRAMIERFEHTLGLDRNPTKRARTILRVDAAAGSLDDTNWILSRGYQLHGKDYSSVRARALATTVRDWHDDPNRPGRQVGLVGADSLDFVRQIRRVALRWRTKNHQWSYAVIQTTLAADEILHLMGEDRAKVGEEATVLLSYARFYDQRGGGAECEIKQDKQTGMRTRQKKAMEGQRMVQLLTALAHNVILWSRAWLAETDEKVEKLGIKRMIRDVYRISGRIRLTGDGTVTKIVLNGADAMAVRLAATLDRLLAREQIPVRLGKV